MLSRVGVIFLFGVLSSSAWGAGWRCDLLKLAIGVFLVHLGLLTKLRCNEAFRSITRCVRVVIP